MSKRLYFINDSPNEIRLLLKNLSRSRLLRETERRGYPEPTDINKFCIVVSKGRIELCYKYFKGVSVLMDLDAFELPQKGWRLYVG